MSRLQAKPWLRVAAAGLLLGLAVQWIGTEALLAQLQRVDGHWFAAACISAVLANLLSAWRWRAIAGVLDMPVSPGRAVLAYAQGIALNTVLPGGTLSGDAWRAMVLVRQGHGAAVAAVSVAIDRLSGLWMLCVVSLIALAGLVLSDRAGNGMEQIRQTLDTAGTTSRGVAWPAEGAMLIVGLGLVGVLVLPWLPWRQVGRFSGSLVRLHVLVRDRRAALWRSIWPSLGVQLLSALTLWLCVCSTGVQASWLAVAGVAAPLFIAAALPVSVAGFGSRELAAALLFPVVGLAAETGIAASLLYGACALLQGLIAAPLLGFGFRPSRQTGDSSGGS